MKANSLKFVAALFIFAVWIVFAWVGKTPVDGLITALGAALSGLGIYHSVRQSNAPADPAPAIAPPTPPAVDAPVVSTTASAPQ